IKNPKIGMKNRTSSHAHVEEASRLSKKTRAAARITLNMKIAAVNTLKIVTVIVILLTYQSMGETKPIKLRVSSGITRFFLDSSSINYPGYREKKLMV